MDKLTEVEKVRVTKPMSGQLTALADQFNMSRSKVIRLAIAKLAFETSGEEGS